MCFKLLTKLITIMEIVETQIELKPNLGGEDAPVVWLLALTFEQVEPG